MLDRQHHGHVDVLERGALHGLQELLGAAPPDEVGLRASVEPGDRDVLPAQVQGDAPLEDLVESRGDQVLPFQRVPRLQERGVGPVGGLDPVLGAPVAEEEQLQHVRIRRHLRQLLRQALLPVGAQLGVVLHDEVPRVRLRCEAPGRPLARGDLLPQPHVGRRDGDDLRDAPVAVPREQLLHVLRGRAAHRRAGELGQRGPEVGRLARGGVHAGQPVVHGGVKPVCHIVPLQQPERLVELARVVGVESPGQLGGDALHLQAFLGLLVAVLVDGHDEGAPEAGIRHLLPFAGLLVGRVVFQPVVRLQQPQCVRVPRVLLRRVDGAAGAGRADARAGGGGAKSGREPPAAEPPHRRPAGRTRGGAPLRTLLDNVLWGGPARGRGLRPDT
mmetsp:Transcript_76002/g.198224  ORF Transcript_76002/g.198224 Transcript_76002/m.198224 type:complete len:387 (+) Transcript_76002:267-1427(+)